MKHLEDFTWDQLYSFRYDLYPHRLVVISPLKNDEVKVHFKEKLKNTSNFDSFENYLQSQDIPAMTAIFYGDNLPLRKNEIFSQIATMGDRMRMYTSMLL